MHIDSPRIHFKINAPYFFQNLLPRIDKPRMRQEKFQKFVFLVGQLHIVATNGNGVLRFIEKYSPALYNALGIFLPLIAVNCAVLGGSLFMQQRGYANIGEVTCFALGSGIGWLLAIVGIAAIRERLRYSAIPPALKGVGITFIITGLMGIAFMSFMGIKL